MTNAKKEIVERIVEREVIRLIIILSFMRIDFSTLLPLMLLSNIFPLCIVLCYYLSHCTVLHCIVLHFFALHRIAFCCTVLTSSHYIVYI